MTKMFLAALALILPVPAIADELIVRGDRLFISVEVGGEETEALLDSGAEVTIFDASFARRAGIAGGEEVVARGTGASTTTAQLVEGSSIAVMGRPIVLPVAAVMDLSDIEARLVRSAVPVIAGREIFDAGRLAIDVEAGLIRWLSEAEGAPGTRVSLSGAHGIETIPVDFGNGRIVPADFDLGNGTGLLISSDLADRLGLEPVGVEPAGGIGGAVGRLVVYVPELTIAGKNFRHVRAHVVDDAQVPANIGVGLLRHFRIVTDFANGEVWLDPRD